MTNTDPNLIIEFDFRDQHYQIKRDKTNPNAPLRITDDNNIPVLYKDVSKMIIHYQELSQNPKQLEFLYDWLREHRLSRWA